MILNLTLVRYASYISSFVRHLLLIVTSQAASFIIVNNADDIDIDIENDDDTDADVLKFTFFRNAFAPTYISFLNAPILASFSLAFRLFLTVNSSR